MTVRTISVLISLVALAAIFFGMAVVAGSHASTTREDPAHGVPAKARPVDHSAFFPDALPDGPAVTRACLGCHADAAREVMATSHWTWAGEEATSPLDGEPVRIGKRNLQNNFCISIAANWARCTSCHVGYGWKDDSFFEDAGEAQVDCLVCHDGSGRYLKAPKGAGAPVEGLDLQAIARQVARTSRATCGTCHFKGGGGDGVKHGDLDETMYFPSPHVDVHMGTHGLECADCHQAEHHAIRGRLLPPERDPATRVRCTDCHAEAPHAQDRLNSHVRTLACQTCHVPLYAVETGTKMWWDWSKAGLEGDEHEVADRLVREIQTDPAARVGIPAETLALFDRIGSDPDVWAHYAKIKGLFVIARRQVPEYRWYDGTTQRYLPGERVAEDEIAAINRPRGGAQDLEARIWPFKVHRGRQPYDGRYGYLLSPHVFGPGGYWATFDWESALVDGAEASGVPYSGEHGWKSTEMYWPQNHMVQAASRALDCTDCHGVAGRMDWRALGYPGDPAFQGDRRQMDLLREGDAAGDER